MTDTPDPIAESPPTSPEQLLSHLTGLGIAHQTVRHAPVFTVEESRHLRETLPGGHCKSLFLRNKKGDYWLVVADQDRPVDLKSLGAKLSAGRLSFASAERLWQVLGVLPGAVTPFALINDTARVVTVVLDRGMLAEARLNYHPLVNDRTTGIARDDLLKFIDACGHARHLVDLDDAG